MYIKCEYWHNLWHNLIQKLFKYPFNIIKHTHAYIHELLWNLCIWNISKTGFILRCRFCCVRETRQLSWLQKAFYSSKRSHLGIECVCALWLRNLFYYTDSIQHATSLHLKHIHRIFGSLHVRHHIEYQKWIEGFYVLSYKDFFSISRHFSMFHLYMILAMRLY